MAEAKINNEISYQGIYPTVFKKIDASDVMINPFQVFKSWSAASGSSTSSLLPLTAIYSDINVLPALGSELTYNDAMNIDGSLQTIIYHSINHLFYKYKGQPNNTYGPTDLTRTQKYLYQSASVFSIPQVKIGEGIKPGSLVIQNGIGSIVADRYSNLHDTSIDTSSFATDVMWYEGFNEYFDTTRITYTSANVTYIDGVSDTDYNILPVGLAARFDGAGYIESELPGLYDRDHDYAISFWIQCGQQTANTLIATKASSSITPQYPFRIEMVSGSNKIKFSVAGSTTFKTQITSSVFNTAWNHIVCQKQSDVLKIYINGSLNASISSSLLINTLSPFTASARIDNSDKLYIGGYDIGTGTYTISGSNLNKCSLDEMRVFNKALSTVEIASLASATILDGKLLQTNHVGNVFTKQGIAVVSTPDYRYNTLITTDFSSVDYRSTVTINELSVVAKLDAGDFNMSTNLTLTKDNDVTYQPFVSGSDFAPYITTIGLYDDAGQLLAIGKMAQVIRKRDDVDMNFLIRIDLDKNIAFKGE